MVASDDLHVLSALQVIDSRSPPDRFLRSGSSLAPSPRSPFLCVPSRWVFCEGYPLVPLIKRRPVSCELPTLFTRWPVSVLPAFVSLHHSPRRPLSRLPFAMHEEFCSTTLLSGFVRFWADLSGFPPLRSSFTPPQSNSGLFDSLCPLPGPFKYPPFHPPQDMITPTPRERRPIPKLASLYRPSDLTAFLCFHSEFPVYFSLCESDLTFFGRLTPPHLIFHLLPHAFLAVYVFPLLGLYDVASYLVLLLRHRFPSILPAQTSGTPFCPDSYAAPVPARSSISLTFLELFTFPFFLSTVPVIVRPSSIALRSHSPHTLIFFVSFGNNCRFPHNYRSLPLALFFLPPPFPP